MDKPAPPSRDLPSHRLPPHFPAQKPSPAASVRESTASRCRVRRPYVLLGLRICLRSLSSTAALGRRYYRSTGLSCNRVGTNLPESVTEANAQNGLPRILENVDDLPRRSFQIKMRAIGKQVYVGTAGNNFAETLTELALQETHDFADSLQREAFAAEFADYCHFHYVLHRVEAAVALALGLDHAALVPPLELAGGDAG